AGGCRSSRLPSWQPSGCGSAPTDGATRPIGMSPNAIEELLDGALRPTHRGRKLRSRPMMIRRPLATLVSAVLLMGGVAACSSDSDGDTGTHASTAAEGETSTTSPAVAVAEPAYAERGPYTVGSRELELDDGRRVV